LFDGVFNTTFNNISVISWQSKLHVNKKKQLTTNKIKLFIFLSEKQFLSDYREGSPHPTD
jgi:hypothetical protein